VEAGSLAAKAKTLDIQVAVELLTTTTNESIKVRPIGFIAGGGKSPPAGSGASVAFKLTGPDP
jgi:hypothetical protein